MAGEETVSSGDRKITDPDGTAITTGGDIEHNSAVEV